MFAHVYEFPFNTTHLFRKQIQKEKRVAQSLPVSGRRKEKERKKGKKKNPFKIRKVTFRLRGGGDFGEFPAASVHGFNEGEGGEEKKKEIE